MVKHKYISAEEPDLDDFQSTLTALWNVLPWWCLGAPFSILSFQLRVDWMNPWLVSH